MTDRRYRMIRVSKGDYLLPSNDLSTLWRISTYQEQDGSTVWGLWKYDRPFRGTLDLVDDPDFFEWGSHWLHWAGPLRTRQEAIDDAVRIGAAV